MTPWYLREETLHYVVTIELVVIIPFVYFLGFPEHGLCLSCLLGVLYYLWFKKPE